MVLSLLWNTVLVAFARQPRRVTNIIVGITLVRVRVDRSYGSNHLLPLDLSRLAVGQLIASNRKSGGSPTSRTMELNWGVHLEWDGSRLGCVADST